MTEEEYWTLPYWKRQMVAREIKPKAAARHIVMMRLDPVAHVYPPRPDGYPCDCIDVALSHIEYDQI